MTFTVIHRKTAAIPIQAVASCAGFCICIIFLLISGGIEHIIDKNIVNLPDSACISRTGSAVWQIDFFQFMCYPDDPELDYHNLDGVHNGSEASAAFADMASHSPEEITVIRQNLLKYCGLDTFAMVKVLRRLREAAGV